MSVAERLGHPPDARLLVIHADDFGMSHSMNRAIIEAFEQRWVTSSSVMVPCPWFPEAATFARTHPEACLGVHLTLNSEWTTFRWGPLLGRDAVPSLVDAEGYLPLLETQVVEQASVPHVEAELRAQIDTAKRAGIAVTHLDSHMLTLLRSPALFSTYVELSRRYAVPIHTAPVPTIPRDDLPLACRLIDGACEADPSFLSGSWLEGYQRVLAKLGPGAHVLTVHLGYDDDEMRGASADHPNWGAAWRRRDLDLVASDAFRRFLGDEGFVLVSWRDLAPAANE
jgi:predicted glycoside hydrolase/deacetylase ChbG (UPF0249 family)